MTLTILDVTEQEVTAAETLREWEEEWQRAYNAPLVAVQKVLELMSMTEEQIEYIQNTRPEDFKRANRYIRELHNSVIDTQIE